MSGESGHLPYHTALITQPTITGLFDRKPDFMWLAKDSLNFNPVFIEIEAPNKRMFTQGGVPTTDFIKARNQLTEWKSIMQSPVNIQLFHNAFSISQSLQILKFKPHYVLIFGRRSEFENSTTLTQKRANIMAEDEYLMSFDRLSVHPKCFNMITCDVRQGDYIAKYVSPIFKLNPDMIDWINAIKGIDDAIDRSSYITDNRKAFLKRRLLELHTQSQQQKGKIVLPSPRQLNRQWE